MFDGPLATIERPPGLRLYKIRRAHLVGVGGAGMRALADVLDEAGWQVSGSDESANALARATFRGRPAPWQQGHGTAEIDDELDLVVHSDAVPTDNLELERARQLGVKTLNYPQAIGQLMQSRTGVAIAGTHGKSTTTALAGEILTRAGMDPTMLVGAAPIGADSGGRYGASRWMLAEACEYRSNFLQLRPEMAAILNIEPDHFDCFATPAELEAAFASFAGQIADSGLLLSRAECATAARVAEQANCSRETFGFSSQATWQATALQERQGYYAFEIRCRQRLVCHTRLSIPGRHNVANALAAAALASHCGASATAIRQGLEEFPGLKRRLQLLGEVHGVAIVDDYAHHPTEVAASLTAVRQMYPDRRLWCVFQPHQASRLTHLLEEFANSLHSAASSQNQRVADKIIIADIYRARETTTGGVTAGDLAARVADLGGDVLQLASAAEIRNHLQKSLLPGDVLITMGAGDIGTVAYELGKGLRTFRKAG